jgi:ribosomal protein L11 methyltransferase
MPLWEARVEIARSGADAAEAALLESGGAEWSILEDAVGGRAWIIGIFPSPEEALSRWGELLPALPVRPAAEPTVRALADEDWRNSYRGHFKAWRFGRLHWVPVWERGSFRQPPGDSVLWLDPGLAFGTGNHETTRLCIERMVGFERSLGGGAGRLRMADAGCGSGILALSASLLGFGDVSGFDSDPEAVGVSLDNARLNGLEGRVRFAVAGLPGGFGGSLYDFVAANIQSDVLVRHSDALASAVAPGGVLAMSGILAEEISGVRAAFERAAPGWGADSRVLGEWCDLCLRRPPGLGHPLRP